MNLNEIMAIDKKYFMNVYGDRVPVCFKYGKGINLWDLDDKMYYDFLGGIAVNVLGHSHPNLVSALKEQIEMLIHTSSLYYIESQAKLSKALVDNSCADKVFLCNSGAEANEGAIKLARIHFKKKGFDNKYEIITLKKSFHGRTLTTVAATGQEKYQKPYHPLIPGFKHVEINDIAALKSAITPSTCAIMLEPVQGESGVNPVEYAYMQEVVKLCKENGLLLIFDEVQTGMGRTGKMFGYEQLDVQPDIFTLAKALGGGVPIGAVCAKLDVAKAFEPGDHGTTFGGNPLSCAAANAVIETILDDNLIKNSEEMGKYFIAKLSDLKDKYDIIKEVRGKGLMIGIEFRDNISKEINNSLFEKGFLVGSVGTNVLRFLPPLIVNKDEITLLIDALDSILLVGKLVSW